MVETMTVVWLLVWGTVVALDLAAVGQVMLARPFVAGTIAGAIAGDWSAGLAVGAVLELFALDVLPVGATRYPDYGPAAVVAAVAAAGAPDVLGLGLALTIGLGVAWAGEWGITLVRRLNTADVRRQRDRLDAGDVGALAALQLRGVLRDACRGFALTALGLGVVWLSRHWSPVSVQGAVLLSAVVIGAGLSAGTQGALRLAGRGLQLAWLGAGVAAGLVWVIR